MSVVNRLDDISHQAKMEIVSFLQPFFIGKPKAGESLWEDVGTEGGGGLWITPTLLNGWMNAGSPYHDLQYRLGADEVEFRGHITGGVSGTVAFNFPLTDRLSTDWEVLLEYDSSGTPGVAMASCNVGTGDVTVVYPVGGGSGGSDVDVLGAWATVYCGTRSVADSTNVLITFDHFETSDTSVFTTAPYSVGGVSTPAVGDGDLRILKPGGYAFDLQVGWELSFSQTAAVNLSIQTFHGGGAWEAKSNAVPAGMSFQPGYVTGAVFMVTDNDLVSVAGAPWCTVEVWIQQFSGAAKNITNMRLRVIQVPTSGSSTAVY